MDDELNKDPIYDSIEVTLQIPKHVDKLWRALGYSEEDYQYNFYDVMRSTLELIAMGVTPPSFKGAIDILKWEIQRVEESV